METVDYILIEKSKKEFQMVLNQWKHKYDFEIIWMAFRLDSGGAGIYNALIKREVKE